MCEIELKREQEMEVRAMKSDSKNDDICIEGVGETKSKIPFDRAQGKQNPKSQAETPKKEEVEVNPIKNMGIVVLGMN